MKRLICALVIIVLSCGISVSGHIYVNNTLDEILYVAENDTREAVNIWQEKKRIMSVFLKNSDIDSIDEEIYALEQYAKEDNSEETEDGIKQITAVIRSIREGEAFNFGNIF